MMVIVLTDADAFPLDATETIDTDRDGIGNNADNDDDNDGLADNLDESPKGPLGYVLKGPLSGAKVFYDLNANGVRTIRRSLSLILMISRLFDSITQFWTARF